MQTFEKFIFSFTGICIYFLILQLFNFALCFKSLSVSEHLGYLLYPKEAMIQHLSCMCVSCAPHVVNKHPHPFVIHSHCQSLEMTFSLPLSLSACNLLFSFPLFSLSLSGTSCCSVPAGHSLSCLLLSLLLPCLPLSPRSPSLSLSPPVGAIVAKTVLLSSYYFMSLTRVPRPSRPRSFPFPLGHSLCLSLSPLGIKLGGVC